MLQNESDGAEDLRQRADGWVRFEDRLGGAPIPKVVHHHIQANARPSNVVTAVADFDVLVGRHHSSILTLQHCSLRVCKDTKYVLADVAYALVRAASRLSRNPAPLIHAGFGITN